jgi:hypothetical protein
MLLGNAQVLDAPKSRLRQNALEAVNRSVGEDEIVPVENDGCAIAPIRVVCST